MRVHFRGNLLILETIHYANSLPLMRRTANADETGSFLPNRFHDFEHIKKAKDEDLAFELQLEGALQESLREQDRQTVVALHFTERRGQSRGSVL